MMMTNSSSRSDNLLANNHSSRTRIIVTNVTVLDNQSPRTDEMVLIRHSGDDTMTVSVLLQELITHTERHDDDEDDEAVVAMVGASHTPHHHTLTGQYHQSTEQLYHHSSNWYRVLSSMIHSHKVFWI